MKKLILTIALSTLAVTASQALVLANWNFNSNPPDRIIPTGSFAPDQGRGTLRLIGGVRASFVAGNPIDSSSDNSALSTFSYPAQLTGNKTAGIELKVSTLGHYNVRFAFTVRVSEDASRDMLLQYTLDGSNYLDSLSLPLVAALGFMRVSNNFASVAKVDNNPNFGFRIVSQYSTAPGDPATNGYAASSQPYSPQGRVRFDELRIWADSFLTSEPPHRPALSSLVVPENTPEVTVPFVLSARDHAPADLMVDAYSSNELLVRSEEMTVTGTGTNRQLVLRPLPGRIGAGLITLCLSTPEGHFTNSEFQLTVTPLDAPPEMGPLAPRTIQMNERLSVPFTIGSGAATSSPFFLTADVSNPTLTPAAQVTFDGEGTNRTVSIVPALQQYGNSTITLLVWDRHRRVASNAFVLTVLPSAETLVCESFTYHPGSLITNAPGLWTAHSGAPGQIPVIRGQPWLVGNQSEDVSVALPGGPYTPASGTVLYAGFNLICRVLPAASSQYFAHFNASAFRARVFVTTAEAMPNSYRVGIANNSGDPEWYPVDLKSEDSHRLVIRYVVASGETTLWMEPNSEQDAGLVATDPPSPTTITAYGFRQNSGIGSLSIDDLKVGTSFAAVARRFPPRFTIYALGNREGEIQWLDDIYGYVLEFSTNAFGGPWTPLDGEPFIGADGIRVTFFDLRKPVLFYRLRATNNPPWVFRAP